MQFGQLAAVATAEGRRRGEHRFGETVDGVAEQRHRRLFVAGLELLQGMQQDRIVGIERQLLVEQLAGVASAAMAFEKAGIGADQDRKSGVTGKSGEVRLDLGGRRIIKKKKKNT